MKVVTPFRDFAPESIEHHRLGPFDWRAAIVMLRDTVHRSCQCDTFVLTDVDTDVPGPAHSYETTRRRLMLWILEVSLAYLRSDDFDRDTVMVSPDVLVFGDLRPFFLADLGLLVRTGAKFKAKPDKQVLNSVQWWRHSSKKRLVSFYTRALDLAEQLPDDRIVWGADTDPLITLASPVQAGQTKRAKLRLYGVEMHTVMRALSSGDMAALDAGTTPKYPDVPLVDFKYERKRYQQRYFDAVVRSAVPA